MKKLLSLTSLALVLSSAFIAASACSSEPEPTPGPTGETASLNLHLDLAQDVAASSASYTITGPGGFSKAGSIDVSHSATLSALIGGIPAGSGYSITVSLASNDGSVSCGGSATFDVSARAVTQVAVHLTCHEPAKTGSVQVNGTVNVCPGIDAVNANPGEVIVGCGIHLSATAHDADHGPAALGYKWTATSGVFDNANAQNPLFTCALPGPATITLVVSDGDAATDCADDMQVTVNCDNPPPQPYAWVVMGSGGVASARVVTPDAACPSITVDGAEHAMSVRAPAATIPARTSSASPVKPSAFPVTTCEYSLPPGAHTAGVYGHELPLPKANPQKIVVIGDTGCRLKTGNPWQACSDTTQWPFQRIADAAAALHPDLVLHVGDYHYRENACPSDVTGCQGSPWSYGFDAWEADLFMPAASLLEAAPWVMVRGNHEECLRAGQGWFRFLDTRPFSEAKSCNDPANDDNANYNAPYAVPVGPDTQFIVFDSAKAGANPLNPSGSASDAKIFNTYQAELQQAAALAANPAILSIWTNHHPLLAYTPAATGNPTGGQGSILSVMSATYSTAYYPPNIGLAFHGHVHDFQAVDFATGQPPTFVSGMGGDNLDLALPDPFPMTLQPAAGATPDMVADDNAFGFMTMERSGTGPWTYKAFKVDGTLMTTCTIDVTTKKLGCAPSGFLH